jgi:hypothetical protein
MPDRGKILLTISAIIFLYLPPIQSDDLTDITGSVFGNYSGVIPAAFGDFNGDKLTDMFVVSVEVEPPHDVVTVTVLLAQEQKVVGSASTLTPLFHWGTAKQKLKCRVPKVRRIVLVLFWLRLLLLRMHRMPAPVPVLSGPVTRCQDVINFLNLIPVLSQKI